VGHWLIGHFAHNKGRSHYEITNAAVQGRNIPFTSLLTMGESWHNNHHAFPGSARLGLFAGEWDPGWWLLMALKRCGLVWGIVLPAALPPRAELHALDAAGDAALARMRTTTEMPRRLRPANGQPNRPRTTLAQVAKLCNSSGPFVLEGPAATLSSAVFRRITGHQATFKENPTLGRLSAAIGTLQLRGLPALCVTVARRNRAWRAVAIAISPLAVAFENLRESFEMA
jgi:stearoyl-CoA desaturase (delta-9 desaturase)